MNERRQFVDWLYEKSEYPRDSVVVARAIFFSHIPQSKSQNVSSLFMDVFTEFLYLTRQTFGKDKAVKERTEALAADRALALRHPQWFGQLAVLGKIPESELTAAFKDWASLKKLEGAETLCDKLRVWGRAQNLDVEWCYDHAIKILAGWMTDHHIMWLGQHDNVSTISELTATWGAVARKEQLGWDWKRLTLDAAAYEVRPFRFKCKKGLFFRAPSWRFLVEEKTPWAEFTSRKFDRFLAKRTLVGDPPPLGIRGKFKRALADYLKETEARKQAAISKHRLVRPPQYYEGQDINTNMKRLIRFQIPECETYEQISEGANPDTIRKHVQRTARFIGLPLRSRRVRAPKGPSKVRPQTAHPIRPSKPSKTPTRLMLQVPDISYLNIL